MVKAPLKERDSWKLRKWKLNNKHCSFINPGLGIITIDVKYFLSKLTEEQVYWCWYEGYNHPATNKSYVKGKIVGDILTHHIVEFKTSKLIDTTDMSDEDYYKTPMYKYRFSFDKQKCGYWDDLPPTEIPLIDNDIDPLKF